MCGIAGIIPNAPASLSSDLLKRMLGSFEHRGPDDAGWLHYSSKGVILDQEPREPDSPAKAVFLHQRLSILDLSTAGRQPMGTPDGRYYIVFNGEIYNYLELRNELEGLGYQFRSRSDTEVLLLAYAHWGKEVLNRLVGMFAFAVLDTKQQKLFLARDFFGIKPLYYACGDTGFVFASEIKTLLELPEISRQVNPQRLYLYLRYGLTDHGGDTLFANIRQLPAAHYLELSLNDPQPGQPVRYWQPDLDQRVELSFEDAAGRLRELFLENIGLHLRSDVPVGAALSGGIDSSSIVMAMRELQGSDLDLHVFGYVASEAAINEERWIDLAGSAAEATIHKIQPGPEDLVGDLDNLLISQDEPFGSTSIYAQRCVFQLAHQAGIKVMLDGQGADELMGGYRPYLAARLASLLRQGKWVQAAAFMQRAWKLADAGGMRFLLRAGGLLLPRPLRDRLRGWVGEDLVPDWLNGTWFADRGVRPTSLARGGERDLLRQALHQTFSETSLPMLLRYEDRNSMAFSIESRVPFLTPDLVNFCLTLPEEYIIAPDGTSKALFRRAMRGLVPDVILDRQDKIGFATPEQAWFSTMRPWVEQVLTSEAAACVPALNLPAIKQEWQAVCEGRRRFDFRVWRWVNLIRWVEKFGVSFEN